MKSFFSEPLTAKKPTIRQWVSETFLENETPYFCHPVTIIFEPNKFPEYCFVTEYYRYSIPSAKISRNELSVIVSQPLAIIVIAQNDQIALTLSDQLLPNHLWKDAFGTWTATKYGFTFEMGVNLPSPKATPPLTFFLDDDKNLPSKTATRAKKATK